MAANYEVGVGEGRLSNILDESVSTIGDNEAAKASNIMPPLLASLSMVGSTHIYQGCLI